MFPLGEVPLLIKLPSLYNSKFAPESPVNVEQFKSIAVPAMIVALLSELFNVKLTLEEIWLTVTVKLLMDEFAV